MAIGDGHSPAHERQQSRKHSPPGALDGEMGPCRQGTCAPTNTRSCGTVGNSQQCPRVRTKGRLPQVPGHSPRREKLRDVLQSNILRTPMLVLQMSQAVTHGALPNCAPFNRAPPQLFQLQMGIHHVDVQGQYDLLLTDGAKSRSSLPKRPLWSTTSKTTESFHLV